MSSLTLLILSLYSVVAESLILNSESIEMTIWLLCSLYSTEKRKCYIRNGLVVGTGSKFTSDINIVVPFDVVKVRISADVVRHNL